MSDSDSDFGDFAGGDEEGFSQSSSTDAFLDVLLGPAQEIKAQVDESHVLAELVEEERPRVVYEHLVLWDTHLQPFAWRRSHLRALLLKTLQIEEPHEEPVGVRALDDSLFVKIMGNLSENEKIIDAGSITASLGLLPVAKDVKSEPRPCNELTALKLDILDANELESIHDELLCVIDRVYHDLREQLALQNELEADKTTFEDVVTNLVGHTQRLRRDEIAAYNKKHGRSSKHGRKFRWVR